ncbi:type II toxin-antitoxin system Phd/YefM family antitoxin [Methylomagnum sp.]
MQATLREFETHLPEYLSRALAGEEVTLTQQGKTVLRLSPVPAEKSQADLEREALARLDATLGPLRNAAFLGSPGRFGGRGFCLSGRKNIGR